MHKIRRSNSERAACNLCYDPVGTATQTDDQRQSDEALFPRQPNFNAFSISHHIQNRSQTVVHEVTMRNRLSRFVQRIMSSHLHVLQVREQYAALFVWQSQQDFIVHLLPIHTANCWLRSRFGDTRD